MSLFYNCCNINFGNDFFLVFCKYSIRAERFFLEIYNFQQIKSPFACNLLTFCLQNTSPFSAYTTISCKTICKPRVHLLLVFCRRYFAGGIVGILQEREHFGAIPMVMLAIWSLFPKTPHILPTWRVSVYRHFHGNYINSHISFVNIIVLHGLFR